MCRVSLGVAQLALSFLDVRTLTFATNGFSSKPLKVKLLAGEQKATEVSGLEWWPDVNSSFDAKWGRQHEGPIHKTKPLTRGKVSYCHTRTVSTSVTLGGIPYLVSSQRKLTERGFNKPVLLGVFPSKR